MTMVPHTVGPIHFVGIGGIGMSGIAEILKNLGYTVQGSDIGDSANVQRLRRQGVRVAIGHGAQNLGKARVVVVSTAIQPDNPELLAARAKRLPIVRRADMLAELMRLKRSIAVAGTHGKTTTTAMMAALLDAAEFDPTVVNGGIINAYGTNARLGQGEWIVVEADESDGSFLRLPATVAVVTNIDPEHMEHYGSFDAVRDAFHAFVERVPFYGFAALCIDHSEVQALYGRVTDRRLVTYGFSPQADIRALPPVAEAGGEIFDVVVRARNGEGERRLERIHLSLPGRHNVANALAVIAVARELGIADEVVRRTLFGLEGVKRRFTRTGTVDGVGIIDDYGHHPVEIKAVLQTARARTRGRVIAVVQPHRYTRLANLFDEFCTCFHDADTVLIAPVYAAGEQPIDGASREALVDGVRARGHRNVRQIDGPDDLAPLVADLARPGDLVVCLGAGSITQWANALPGRLAALEKGAGEA
jgi:UDP-N-acetylmuramate--alanine ligase